MLAVAQHYVDWLLGDWLLGDWLPGDWLLGASYQSAGLVWVIRLSPGTDLRLGAWQPVHTGRSAVGTPGCSAHARWTDSRNAGVLAGGGIPALPVVWDACRCMPEMQAQRVAYSMGVGYRGQHGYCWGSPATVRYGTPHGIPLVAAPAVIP